MNLARATLIALTLLPTGASAASFDCERARSKLNRVICSDAELSRLDEVVWNTYGERVRTLTELQRTEVRARHIRWRRERGLYETTVEALTHDYRAHLDWLNHAFMAAEGRYRRGGFGASSARLEVQADLRAAGAVELRGVIQVPVIVAWRAATTGAPDATGPSVSFTPLRPDGAAPLAAECRFTLRWQGDAVELTAEGMCGADFSGRYEREAAD